MEQFVVPQFIDVEDKIFGPITVRQFLIILTAAGIIFLTFRFADIQLFILVLILVGGSALVLAFVKINGQSFHYVILNIIQTLRRPSVRIWRKSYTKEELDYLRKVAIVRAEVALGKKPARREKIRDLALLVNTGGFYKPDEDDL